MESNSKNDTEPRKDITSAKDFEHHWTTDKFYDIKALISAKLALARKFIIDNCLLYPLNTNEDERTNKRQKVEEVNLEKYLKFSDALYIDNTKISKSDIDRGKTWYLYEKNTGQEWHIIPNSETDEFILVFCDRTVCMGGTESFIYCNPIIIQRSHHERGGYITIPEFYGSVELKKEERVGRYRNAVHTISFETRPTIVELFTRDLLIILFSDHNASTGIVYTHNIHTNHRSMITIHGRTMYDDIHFSFCSREVYAKEGIVYTRQHIFDTNKFLQDYTSLNKKDS
jgi:hypothetical protein